MGGQAADPSQAGAQAQAAHAVSQAVDPSQAARGVQVQNLARGVQAPKVQAVKNQRLVNQVRVLEFQPPHEAKRHHGYKRLDGLQ